MPQWDFNLTVFNETDRVIIAASEYHQFRCSVPA
jgi:hypothetical protein